MTRIALTGLTNAIPLPVYCDSVNMLARLRGRSYRLRPFGEVGIHVAEDGTGADAGRIHICRRGRHWRYKRGVMRGVDVVARQYGLHTLDIRPGGVFVDCGANVGELGLWARQRGLAYVAFEPEELEARCCDLNNFEGRPETRRKALWHEAAVLQFHSKPDTADSSVFEIDAAAPPRDVEAVRLDTVVDPAEFGPGTRIFKLEAEGAEPEVLAGATGVLPHFDYVAADCGYERGRDAAHTFVEVHDLLLEAGYRLVHASFGRITAIYRNEARAG
jgi:FkbM family methyltransferase